MTIHPLHIIPSLLMALSSLSAHATYPDSLNQRMMQEEEQAFLENMEPGLQHTQMLAVRKAMQGNDSDLQQMLLSSSACDILTCL